MRRVYGCLDSDARAGEVDLITASKFFLCSHLRDLPGESTRYTSCSVILRAQRYKYHAIEGVDYHGIETTIISARKFRHQTTLNIQRSMAGAALARREERPGNMDCSVGQPLFDLLVDHCNCNMENPLKLPYIRGQTPSDSPSTVEIRQHHPSLAAI
ncbi:hypothetical protein AB1N83_008675 [Pleurotus pulmonarius]